VTDFLALLLTEALADLAGVLLVVLVAVLLAIFIYNFSFFPLLLLSHFLREFGWLISNFFELLFFIKILKWKHFS
jgi:hypothetical protein